MASRSCSLEQRTGCSRRTLPHRPDALLALRLPSAHEGQQRANFFYEADRNTTALPRFKQKVEAYIHHLKQRKHEALNIKRIRAVLVETTTDERIAALMTVVAAFAASEPLAGVLFWFATAGKESDSPFSPGGCVQETAGYGAFWTRKIKGLWGLGCYVETDWSEAKGGRSNSLGKPAPTNPRR